MAEGRYTLIHGDCLDVLASLEPGSVDAVVTDPPYGLGFMGKEWDTPGSFVERKAAKQNRFDHVGGNHNPSNGFDQARTRKAEGVKFQTWCVEWATACLRVLKPGGYLLSFGGTRTWHRLACALEDAGAEIRDTLCWLYGTGFPKGRGCLKPAWEPIILARKPGKGVLPLGVDECRVPTEENLNGGAYARDGADRDTYEDWRFKRQGGAGQYKQPAGRWPANVVHDGSAEVLEAFAAFGETHSGTGTRAGGSRGMGSNRLYAQDAYTFGMRRTDSLRKGDTGTAARFFYTAKASRKERGEGNSHPTVKPLALMEWLVKLVCPPDGLCLDPFLGSGTTGKACQRTGRRFIGIELDPTYFIIAQGRLATAEPALPLFAALKEQP